MSRLISALYQIVFMGGLLVFQDAPAQEIPNQFDNHAIHFPKSCLVKGMSNTKDIALTFDDGPSELTPVILDLLRKYQIKASFFWQGKNLLEHPEIAVRAKADGHELANHSWDHPNCEGMNPSDLWNEQILPTNGVFDSLLGLHVNLYRPPFGAVSGDQLAFLEQRGFTTVLWSISTLDWDINRNSGDEIFETFKKGLHPGAIVLMHDMDFGDSAFEKINGLERLIRYAQQEGYRFLSITALKNNL